MSQPWVPHHQHPSRAAWHSRWAVLQLEGRLFLFLFRHFPGPLDEIAHNSSFKEAVFADGRSNTSVTLVTAPAVGRAVSKLTQLSSPERTLLWTSTGQRDPSCYMSSKRCRSRAGLQHPCPALGHASLQSSAILHKPRLQAPYSTGHSPDLHSSITRRSSQLGTSRAEVSIPSSSIL